MQKMEKPDFLFPPYPMFWFSHPSGRGMGGSPRRGCLLCKGQGHFIADCKKKIKNKKAEVTCVLGYIAFDSGVSNTLCEFSHELRVGYPLL